MQRLLNTAFENDLLFGRLKDLLDNVSSDNSLDLKIRENYFNIYYKGGSILKVIQTPNDYDYFFDVNYLPKSSPHLVEVQLLFKSKDWFRYFALTKHLMDQYFTNHQKEEREFQQLVVRENNYSSISNGTDYFIIDIEYDNHDGAKFDIVALEWLSDGSKRKLHKGYKPKLVVIEMKYGDKSISGSSGLSAHYNDFKIFISSAIAINNFKLEMLNLFEQKRKLGLIPCLSSNANCNEIKEVEPEVDIMFLIANHDPESIALFNEINSNQDLLGAKFLFSNYFGYGLFSQNVFQGKELLKSLN